MLDERKLDWMLRTIIRTVVVAGAVLMFGVIVTLFIEEPGDELGVLVCSIWCVVVPFLRRHSIPIRLILWTPVAGVLAANLHRALIPFLVLFALLFLASWLRTFFIHKTWMYGRAFWVPVVLLSAVVLYPLSLGPTSVIGLSMVKHSWMPVEQYNSIHSTVYAPIWWLASRSPAVDQRVRIYCNDWMDLFLRMIHKGIVQRHGITDPSALAIATNAGRKKNEPQRHRGTERRNLASRSSSGETGA